jgi:predicted flap endonuclease-1-like 5' DNA nuclease
MMALLGANGLLLLIALLIGFATGWWAWARMRVSGAASAAQPATAPPQPVAAVAPAPLMAASGPAIPLAVGAPDDLLQLKGVGPKLNALLNGLGVTRFDQIAAWGAREIGEVDAHLGSFKGRIVRDEWVHQAGLLAKGQIAAFEAKYGKLDSENK